MDSPERISAQKADHLIAWLEASRTLVKISVPHKNFERLTLITDRGHRDGRPAFAVDPPEGLADAISMPEEDAPPMLQFEFSGEDRLLHRFETRMIDHVDRHLWLGYPEEIQRYQLRDNFRIKAPSKAELALQIDDQTIQMAVDNISLGGIFCICRNNLKQMFSPEMPFYRLLLQINLIEQRHIIAIDRAVVRRLEKGVRPKHFGIAFQFTTMKSEAREQLTKVIYDLQRQFLKNRHHNQ